jgi:transposase-like protein
MKGIPQGRYTKEFREEAVKLVTEGNMTIPAAARRLSLPPSTVGNRLRASKSGKLAEIGKSQKPLTEIEILKNAIRVFVDRCISGIGVDADRCRRYAESSMALAAALNMSIGYARAAEVVKRALHEQKTIIDVVREEKLLTEAQIAQILAPAKLTEPGLPGKLEESL